MKYDQLINKKYHILQRNKITKDKERFIYNEIANRLNNSLDGINLKINDCLEIGYSSQNISKYLIKNFKNINLTNTDISKDLIHNYKNLNHCIYLDHDDWNTQKKKYDLIISNFYLHLTNNFDILLKNINQSLNKNGFFVASLPGRNCFLELKNTMIEADINLYGGAFKRFNTTFSIEYINKILKKNNFKIPLIDIDTFYLKYKKFNKLLNDIRYLANTNITNNRKKKFENKNYFNEVEKLYWNKYSNNNEIILQLEIIFISGWKEDISQQQPLNPGEAKISLKDALK